MADILRWRALCRLLIQDGHMTPMAEHQILKLVREELPGKHVFERRTGSSPRSRMCRCGKTKSDIIHEVKP